MLSLAATFCLQAQTNVAFTRLVSFDGTNGAMPFAGLTLGKDGNFYGTTCRGGEYGNGTIFKMTPDGRITKLFSFNGTSGYFSDGELVQGKDENLYGMTTLGEMAMNLYTNKGLAQFLESNVTAPNLQIFTCSTE